MPPMECGGPARSARCSLKRRWRWSSTSKCFGTSAADGRRSARPVLPNSRGEQLPRDPLYERYDEIHASRPTQLTERESRQASLEMVYRYHDGTKHHFHAFAQSLGYLDWASQPRPFRGFADTPVFPLYPTPGVAADGYARGRRTFDPACQLELAAEPLSAPALGDMLRHALGLSAWKRFGSSRWSLRVNPSSGNLHPTEAYVICGALPGLVDQPAVYHYAADRHAIELRCVFDEGVWREAFGGRRDVLLVALTSIHWREAWKYGERAFRYCQHDLGHAIAAVSVAAALIGWRAVLLPAWSHRAIAAVTGIDREEDFTEAEREEPGCIMAIAAAESADCSQNTVEQLVDGIPCGQWSGHANQLSEDHIEWSFIDEVAQATEEPGRSSVPTASVTDHDEVTRRNRQIDARALLLQRRSARRLRRPLDDRPRDTSSTCCRASCLAREHRGTVCGGRRAFISPSSSIASSGSRRGCTC